MQIKPRDIERFLAAPDPNVRAVLVYGPDQGLVRERAKHLVKTAAGDAGDPFRVAELSARQVIDEPASLADEAAALSLTGGGRAVWLRLSDERPQDVEKVAARLERFLAEPAGEALVVAEAGDLPPRAPLRKAFEKAARGAALPCYRDDARSLPGLIRETLGAQGFQVSDGALAYLAENLGGDRLVTRRELEKLGHYKGPDGGRVELEDAVACVGDTAALSLDDVGFAVGDGDLAGLERAVQRALQEGANPVQPLRAAARHLQRLHQVSGAGDQDQAMKKLRPPVFWKHADRFKAQARAWRPAQLARALERLIEAETRCKRTGMPAETVMDRALMEIASNAPGRRGSRVGRRNATGQAMR